MSERRDNVATGSSTSTDATPATQPLPHPNAENIAPLSLVSSRKRFATTTIENIAAIKERRFEVNTVKSTHWAVKIFKDWLEESNISLDFETLPMSDIDSLLARFYVEVRKVDGQYYSKISLNGLRAALQRYLQNPPWNVTYSILKDGAFLHSNNVLKGLFKTLTEMGLSKSKHFKAIEQGDTQ